MKSKMPVAILIAALVAVVALSGDATGSSASSYPAPVGPLSGGAAPSAGPLASGISRTLAAAGTGFTYQGRLNNNGSPADGQYDFQFTLYDALTGGSVVGTALTLTNQTVVGGLFTVTLDFGASSFQGSARWLEIAVRQAGGGGFTTLAPRQPLTATPYAMSLVPGAVVSGSTGAGGIMLQVSNGGGNALAGFTGSPSDSAVYGVNSHLTSTLGVGVKGQGVYYSTGVEGASSYGYGVYGHSATGPGVFGTDLNGGPGVAGTSAGGPGVYGTSQIGPGGYFTSTNNYGLLATSAAGVGGYFTSTSGIGVYAVSSTNVGVQGNSGTNMGVQGNSSSGWGGYFASDTGTGLQSNSNNGTAVYGVSTSGYGVNGYSTNNTGVYGNTSGSGRAGVLGYSSAITNALGVVGEADTGASAIGVDGYSTSGDGVQGYGGAIGVSGQSSSGYGMNGQSTSNYGVRGISSSAPGVGGSSTSNDGVFGVTNAGGHSGVTGIFGGAGSGNGVYGTVSSAGYAGWFQGNVRITGTCCFAPVGIYQIDNPVDPANKYLNQAAVESPDMLDVLSGNATTDAQGNASVTLPSYFQVSNRDFRYQLTVIGQFAQAIVSTEITNNAFSIKTDKPNVKVSWQVTGTRSDPYAQAHPLTAEQAKPANEKGYYIHPDLYGQPNTKNVDPYARNPQSIAMPAQPTTPGGK